METAWEPKCLDIEASSPTTARYYRHWRTILLNYIDFHDKIPNKYRALLSCLSSRVFEYIKGYTDFEVAIEKLDALFIKIPNKVFVRQLLATRRQKPGESLDEFFREVEKLKKICNFRDNTAKEWGNEAVGFLNRNCIGRHKKSGVTSPGRVKTYISGLLSELHEAEDKPL